MKREDLKKLELSDEAIDKVMGLYGTSVEKLKADLATVSTEAGNSKKQLEEANAAIEGFKKLNPAEIQKTADDWKTKFEEAQTKHADELLSIRRNNALERELKETYKVDDLIAVRAHLKIDDLKFNERDDTFVGLKEQVEPLKEKYGSYFTGGERPPEFVKDSGKQSGKTVALTMDQVKKMSPADINKNWEAVQATLANTPKP